VKQGDVFFTRTSETVDEIGIASVLLEDIEDGVFSGFILRARPVSSYLDLLFKKYCFNSEVVRKQITSTSSYTTRALTNGRLLSRVLIPCPSDKREQHKIAEALSDADRLIEALDRLIAKKRDMKTAIMQQLLTGRKRLPGFEGKWKSTRLGDVSDIRTGKKNNQDKVSDGIFPFFVRSQTIERIDTFSYDGEAILVPGEGGIGSIFHYVNGKFDFHQRVYKISDFPPEINGKFIFYYMIQFFEDQATRNSVKATVDSLRLPTFQNFELKIPELQEQSAIEKILSDVDSEIATLEDQRNKTLVIKRGMMQELLT
jgi:type I restriction enzyme S subunit